MSELPAPPWEFNPMHYPILLRSPLPGSARGGGSFLRALLRFVAISGLCGRGGRLRGCGGGRGNVVLAAQGSGLVALSDLVKCVPGRELLMDVAAIFAPRPIAVRNAEQ